VDTKVSSISARLVQGDTNGSLAGYPLGTDVARLTLASVDTGTVADEVGKANIPSSVALGGSAIAGTRATDAPELVSVRAIPSLEQIEYIFSQQIDRRTGSNPAELGYYTWTGRNSQVASHGRRHDPHHVL
jgi:hypothetical protein